MYAVKSHGDLSDQDRADMAASLEVAVCDVLVKKSVRACNQEGVRHLVIAGGVAANRKLREILAKVAEESDVQLFLPQPKYCTDNAAMIAYAGFLNLMSGKTMPDGWDVQPRWGL